MLITADVLRKVVPLAGNKVAQLAPLMNEICPIYGIKTADIMHEFIAQLAHESGSFNYMSEDLNYSASGLLKVFPKYFNSSNANSYARKPDKIANRVYANRMGNGNEASGDGWKHRGGGYIQITGKDMWSEYAKFIGKTVGETLMLVRSDMRYALDSACWVFAIQKQLIDEADADLFTLITKRINGGLNGLADREAFYGRAKKYIL